MSCSSSFFRLMLTALVATALAGCGGSGGEQASTPAAPGTPASGAGEAGSAGQPAPAPPSDHVVVKVNGGEIRNRQLIGGVETNRLRQQAQGIALDAEGERALREAVLDAAIADELLFQDAKAEGLTATPEEVQRDLEQVRARFDSPENFSQYLKEAGLTEQEVQAFAERRVIVEKHLKALAGNATVTEAEAKAFYDANKEFFRQPEQARAQVVVVRSTSADPEANRKDARRRIEEARAKAAAGGDMAEIAKQYSQIPNAANGGDLGWFGKGDMFPAIENAAFSLKPGQVSEIFETPTGLNFIKVTERRDSKVVAFDEIKARLIVDLGRMKEAQAMEQRVAKLRGVANVEIVDQTFLGPPVPEKAAAPPAGEAGAKTQ